MINVEGRGKEITILFKTKLSVMQFAACFVRTCLFGWDLKMKYLN